ncbi:MAG: TonB family protein [Rhizobacter sp.]|nr:TonB family protein [Burkholderiales bacterium]
MSTLDTAVLWSATSLAFDEKKLGAAGLSVRQRKLLALLNHPASVSQLAQRIALPDDEVQLALQRFAKLGLAQSDAPTAFNPMQLRDGPAHAGVAEKPSRMPLVIGIAVASLALVAASAWLLRGGSGKTSLESAVARAAPVSSPTATGPTDSADSKLPQFAAAPTVASAVPLAPLAPAMVPPGTAAARAALAASAAATNLAAVTPGKTTAAVTTPGLTEVPTPTATAATAAATPTAPATTAAAAVAAPAVATVAPASTPPVAAVSPPLPTPSATLAAATATPAARPAPAVVREIKLINRVEPGFPRGVDAERGTVRARLQVDARGNVTSVEIVESNPPRVFDRTVRAALQQWRYEPTGETFTTAAEISFNR